MSVKEIKEAMEKGNVLFGIRQVLKGKKLKGVYSCSLKSNSSFIIFEFLAILSMKTMYLDKHCV